MAGSPEFEKLGAFYLGREIDPTVGSPTGPLYLYDSKDLTTHAVCVGMTGSGKTGLCVSLLEEAAIDGVPALIIDPKGDLANLLLTFPDLRPEDFRPWIDEGEATRKGATPDEFARKTADLWRNGLGQWGQDGERIRRFRDAVDLAIYTPGSTAGLPLSVLRSFSAPPPALREDGEAFRDRIGSAVSGLLALVGIDADPLRSREHILLSTILSEAWAAGRDVDLATLIRSVQDPPVDKVGVFDLESFFPARDRFGLAMALNNLVASPGFATWLEGDPLDIPRMLWTAEGKPRLSIVSIAHLNDAERMFLVTQLLNEVLAWVRTQPGTSSLRAILYMDEVFGYFPPTANPPSKTPMLTLLKQARAFGLGVVLATQNPVDLDYKGLSNTGTWFLGRLQTERDKARVLEGLEGASASAGASFDKARMEATLAGLDSRVFLVNNVHEDAPVLFHTRWALSYLRGPLTRAQIQRLTDERRGSAATAKTTPAAAPTPTKPAAAVVDRPVLPPGVEETFLTRTEPLRSGESLVYRPALVASTRLHFTQARADLDEWREECRVAFLDDDTLADPWEGAPVLAAAPDEDAEPEAGAAFAEVPAEVLRAASYKRWGKQLVSEMYRNRRVTLWKTSDPKALSAPGESREEFVGRLALLLREDRDRERAKIEERYRTKFATLRDRIDRARRRVEKEEEQFRQQSYQAAVDLGSTVLGALLGRRTSARGASAARKAGRAAGERGDIARAREELVSQQAALAALEEEFREAIATVQEAGSAADVDLVEVAVKPTKSDLEVDGLRLAWVPCRVDGSGTVTPLIDLPA